MWYAQVIGYFFAVVIGDLLIKLVVDRLWECIRPKQLDDPQKYRPDKWQPRLVGVIERVLYVATLQFGKGEFIGFWLALKVAGQWTRWSKEPQTGEKIPHGRSIYQNFLIGNALSVLYAFVGFRVIEWISLRQIVKATTIPLSLIATTIALWAWLRQYRTSDE